MLAVRREPPHGAGLDAHQIGGHPKPLLAITTGFNMCGMRLIPVRGRRAYRGSIWSVIRHGTRSVHSRRWPSGARLSSRRGVHRRPCDGGRRSVAGLDIGEFSGERIDASVAVLVAERDTVTELGLIRPVVSKPDHFTWSGGVTSVPSRAGERSHVCCASCSLGVTNWGKSWHKWIAGASSAVQGLLSPVGPFWLGRSRGS